jgi:hypothetical protein
MRSRSNSGIHLTRRTVTAVAGEHGRRKRRDGMAGPQERHDAGDVEVTICTMPRRCTYGPTEGNHIKRTFEVGGRGMIGQDLRQALKRGIVVAVCVWLVLSCGCNEDQRLPIGDRRYYCNGRVSDVETGTALSSVEVSYWQPQGEPGLRTHTDETGHYRLGLELLPIGLVRFVRASYDTAIVSVDSVFAGSDAIERTVNIGLRSSR